MATPTANLLDNPRLVPYGIPELRRADNPTVGTDFVQAVDSNFFTRVISVHVRLVTDANVASRNVVVEYRDQDDNRYELSGAPVAQTASGTNDWIFSVFQQQAEWTVDGSAIIPLHACLLLPAFDFRVHVENIQAGDQLSRIRFVWERFYTTDVPLLDIPG